MLCPTNAYVWPIITAQQPDSSRERQSRETFFSPPGTCCSLDAICTKDSVQFISVAQLCLTLCNPMDCSTPGFPVHHQLPELAQTHVHRVGDAIQPSHPPSSPSPLPSIFPSIRVFPMNQFFASGSQRIRASASSSVLPMNIQD